MQDDTAVALFGVSEKKVEWDDVTVADNLLTKGRNKLQELINATVSIELSAADLHNLDVNIEAFRIGDNVRVISIPHGLDRYFLLSKLHLELDKPSACSMTLGAVFKTLTQKQLDSQKRINNAIKATEGIVVNISEISSNVREIDTKIDNFIVEVPGEYLKNTDFTTYREYVLNTFLKKSDATTTYVKTTDLADYLKTIDAQRIYAKIVDLRDYLTVTNASSTYATQTNFNTLEARVTALENQNGGNSGNSNNSENIGNGGNE